MNLNMFNKEFENQNWDIETLEIGHEKRFLTKLKNRKSEKQNFWKPLAIACTLVIGFGIVYFVSNIISNPFTKEAVLSPEMQKTDAYFSSIIKTELATIQQNETPQSKKIIIDALQQMEALEKDYELLKLEIKKNGENKQIIYALLTNMQTRISFLKNVLDQVHTLNKTNYENSI